MNNIKKIRKSLNISVTELAQKLGMSQSNLTKIENAQIELKPETALKIAQVLGISPTALQETPKEESLSPLLELINPEALGLAPMSRLPLPFVIKNLPDEAALFAVTDDAMRPLAETGTLVLIDKAVTTPEIDGIYLIKAGGKMLLRRLQNTFNHELIVLTENKSYQPQSIPLTELEIIGKATGILAYTPL